MYPSKLYSGPTIKSRSAARRAAKDLVGIMTVMAVMGLVAGDDSFGECSMSNFSTTISDTRNCHTGS